MIKLSKNIAILYKLEAIMEEFLQKVAFGLAAWVILFLVGQGIVKSIRADIERVKSWKLRRQEKSENKNEIMSGDDMNYPALPSQVGYGYGYLQQTDPVVDLAKLSGNTRAMEMFSNELAKNAFVKESQQGVPHLTALAHSALQADPSANEIEVTDTLTAGTPYNDFFGRLKVRNPVQATRTITVKKR